MVASTRGSDAHTGVDTTALFDVAKATSEETHRRTTLTTTIAAGLSIASFATAALRAWLLHEQTISVVTLVFAGGLFAFASWLGQRRGEAWLGSAMIPVVALLSTFCLALVGRGIYSESLYWVPFAPLVTSFVVPEERPLHVAVLTGLGLSALITAHAFGVFPIGESWPEFWLRSSSLLATVIFGGALGFYYEQANRRAKKMWWYRATHHSLSGLRNRHAFLDTLRLSIDRARRGAGGVALLFLDLDGLKTVNDTYGHDAGDALIREAASRLRDQVRSGDVPCHLGGDEFTVVLEPCENAHIAEDVAERVRASLSKPLVYRGQRIDGISASVGVALYNGDESPEQLIGRADTAMYGAKRGGRNRVELSGSRCP